MLTGSKAQKSPAYALGGVALLVSAGVILMALAFEHIGGYAPCPLCLMQRWAYYASMPLLFAGMALATEKPRLASVLFALVALAFLGNAGLAAYHAGVEWKFWPGPDTCATAAALPGSVNDLMEGMKNRVVRCDEAAWRLFGLSFAGWNVVISVVLTTLGVRAARSTATGI